MVGCSSSSQRYAITQDTAPEKPLSVEHIEDATPKYEKYSLGGNKNYTLRGKRYKIIKDPTNFSQQGLASWYGKKFHGHRTSNGETYDMYSMSAAHKTLPIPSYVKVINLENQRTAIVRVNDRGPFHQGRIIDLSYAAAVKLDVVKTGTAKVKIEHITVEAPASHDAPAHYSIQVSSSNNKQGAQELLNQLVKQTNHAGYLEEKGQLIRVFIGPFYNYQQVQTSLSKLKQAGHSGAFIKKKQK